MPLFGDGDLVQVRRASVYWPGDLVVIPVVAGKLMVHRLLGYYLKNGRCKAITKGDNRTTPDAAVAPGSIVGRVIDLAPFVSNNRLTTIRDRLKAMSAFLRVVASRLRQQ